MATAAKRRWTLDEFLAFDDGSDIRYELFDGVIVAMAPPARGHGTLVGRLAGIIGRQLAPPCEVVVEAGITVPDREDNWYQVDLAVTCKQGDLKDPMLPEPVLIVEVLSPSTAAVDRDRKIPDYRTIPSLSDIVVVSSTAQRVEHLIRDGDAWKVLDLIGGGTLRLAGLPVAIDVAALYDGLDLPEQEPRGRPRPASAG